VAWWNASPARCLKVGFSSVRREADIAKGVMSCPPLRGLKLVPALQGLLTGSEHNDEFYTDELGEVRT